jgi:hypothetical protein
MISIHYPSQKPTSTHTFTHTLTHTHALSYTLSHARIRIHSHIHAPQASLPPGREFALEVVFVELHQTSELEAATFAHALMGVMEEVCMCVCEYVCHMYISCMYGVFELTLHN